MPYDIRLKGLEGHDLAFRIQGKERHVLILSHFKTQQRRMILYSFNRRTAVRGREHIGTRKPGFSFAVIRFGRPFLVEPGREARPGIG